MGKTGKGSWSEMDKVAATLALVFAERAIPNRSSRGRAMKDFRRCRCRIQSDVPRPADDGRHLTKNEGGNHGPTRPTPADGCPRSGPAAPRIDCGALPDPWNTPRPSRGLFPGWRRGARDSVRGSKQLDELLVLWSSRRIFELYARPERSDGCRVLDPSWCRR